MDHSILGQLALAYSPVIDRNRNVTATRLSVFPLSQNANLQPNELLAAISETWPSDGGQLWMNIVSENLLRDMLVAQPGTHILIEVPAFMACDPTYIDPLCTLQANGSTMLLKGRPLHELPREVLNAFKYAIIDFDDDRRYDPATSNPTAPDAADGFIRSIGHVQAGITNVSDMETSFRRGAAAVLGWPIDNIIDESARPADQPALQVIVHLIDQVHKQADIEDLENTLKRDPALAYKLMRYINSPAFGLSVEINSFRHAIMILGYQRLKRWLALLLATASKDNTMRPVMWAALRRGLLMEELSKSLQDSDAKDEMFICGLFSLLDHLLKTPFAKLLDAIPCPERVRQALVEGGGPYQPYLELVRAIEGESAFDYRQAAEGLMMGPSELNHAVLNSLLKGAQLE